MTTPKTLEVKFSIDLNEVVDIINIQDKSLLLPKFRAFVHKMAINKLIDSYGKDAWKYSFINNIKDKFNENPQYNSLGHFEKGASRNENLLLLFMMEIISQESKLKITI